MSPGFSIIVGGTFPLGDDLSAPSFLPALSWFNFTRSPGLEMVSDGEECSVSRGPLVGSALLVGCYVVDALS